MPVQIDAPSATTPTSYSGLYGSAPNKIAALATNDGDTSLVYFVSGGRHVDDLYAFPALAGVADPVTAASLTTVIRVYNTGAGGQNYWHMWNSVGVGTNRWGSFTKAYTTISFSAAGAQLALAAVNGYHGCSFFAAGGPRAAAEVWLTQLYRTVDYNYLAGNAGEFAYMIGSLAGACIGAGLLFREMPDLARFLWKRGRYLIRPDEYEIAYRAWREA